MRKKMHLAVLERAVKIARDGETTAYRAAMAALKLRWDEEKPSFFPEVQLAAIAAKASPSLDVKGIVARVRRLRDVATSLDRYNELDCNEGLSEAAQARSARLEREAVKLGGELGAEQTMVQGDPRGFPVRFVFRDDRGFVISNNMGGEDFGIGDRGQG